MDFKFGLAGPPLKPAVGIDVSPTGFNVAIIDCHADHFPWADELYHLRSRRSLMCFWEARFCDEGWPPVAMNARPHASELLLWLQNYLATEHVIPCVDMQAVMEVATDYDVPRQFLRAHALAQSVAYRLRS